MYSWEVFWERAMHSLFSFEAGPLYCPMCYDTNVVASHRREIHDFVVLPLLLLRPFRCNECHHRFYGLFFRKRELTVDERTTSA